MEVPLASTGSANKEVSSDPGSETSERSYRLVYQVDCRVENCDWEPSSEQ